MNNDNSSEQERLSQIFLQNEGLIRSVIFTRISNRQLADDVFQDFFLSFVTSPPKNHDNLKSYIGTRLTRDIIDHSRKNIRYRNLIGRYSKAIPRKPARHDTPDFKAIVDEERDKMLNLLSGNLTKTQAKAVELRYLDGYDTSETSEIMKVKKRSVSRYLAVGIKKLRKLFDSNSLN